MSMTAQFRRACAQLGLMNDPPAAASTAGNTMRAGLHRAAARGIPVRTVIDVGASNGCWTRLVRQAYPEAAGLLVEAQPVHAESLRRICAEMPRLQYALVAAGERDGKAHFDTSDPFGGLASETPFPENDVVVPLRRIDSLVTEYRLDPPFLLKLDTHGYEVPILTGAAAALSSTELLIVEAYNFELTPGCLRFWELCTFLETHGFRPIDLCDVSRRPADHALWQMDLFFARNSRPEFDRKTYR